MNNTQASRQRRLFSITIASFCAFSFSTTSRVTLAQEDAPERLSVTALQSTDQPNPTDPQQDSQSAVQQAIYVPENASSAAQTVQPASATTVLSSSVSNSLKYLSLDEIAAAQTQLSESRLPSLASAKSQLEEAMRRLESHLRLTPHLEADWYFFLKWNELRQQLAAESPDVLALTQIEKNFRQNYPGLELQPFTAVRDALYKYVQTCRFSLNPKLSIDVVNNRLKMLSELVQKSDIVSDSDAQSELALTLSYLELANQSPTLVNKIHSLFSRPNVRVLASSEFVTRRLTRPVANQSPVNENILGTQICGTGFVNGFVSPTLVPNPNQITVQLQLNAEFNSNNIGYNRGVRVYTTGQSSVVASESVALTDSGLQSLNDTTVGTDLRTTIHDIQAKNRIIELLANKRAAKQKPLADAIGESRMQVKLRTQYHEQLSNQLEEAKGKLAPPALPELTRLGISRPDRKSWSSNDYASLLWKVEAPVQLAAPTSCPLVVQPNGVTIQVHESVVANLFDPVLAGRTIESENLDKYAQQFGKLFQGKIQREEDGPWSITMNAFHPVEVQFNDSLITFRIRTDRLDRGDRSLDQDAAIQASYRPVLTNGEFQLVREGDVKINFTGTQLRGVWVVSMRSFLKKKFDNVFKETLFEKPIRLSEKLPPEFQDIQLVSLTADDGWLQVHLN